MTDRIEFRDLTDHAEPMTADRLAAYRAAVPDVREIPRFEMVELDPPEPPKASILERVGDYLARLAEGWAR